MINCKNASDRLKTSPEMLVKKFMAMGISDEMAMFDLSELELKMLVKYLNQYIVCYTEEQFRQLMMSHKKMREVLLRLTCLSGEVKNMEAIWILIKIVKNKSQQVC